MAYFSKPFYFYFIVTWNVLTILEFSSVNNKTFFPFLQAVHPALLQQGDSEEQASHGHQDEELRIRLKKHFYFILKW